MNDSDFMTAMRDRFAAVRMNTPAETIMARGASLRRRRSGGRLAAGALAISLGAGLSVPALTAGTPTAAAHQHQATLAAWTVDKHPDGSIGVTIRRPQDLTALQRRLAKLGIHAVFGAYPVTVVRDCALLTPARQATDQVRFAPLRRAVAFEIRPGKIPPRAVLWISLPTRGVEGGPTRVAQVHIAELRLALACPLHLIAPVKAQVHPQPSA